MAATNRRYDCMIFDLDGTLLDTRGGMLTALNDVLAGLGRRPVATHEISTSLHHGLRAMLREALESTGVLPDEAACERLHGLLTREYFASAGHCVMPYPHLKTLLRRLRDLGVPMAVCTNQAEEHARRLLDVFGLSGYFTDVAGRDTFALHKPDPTPLVWLMGRCGARPNGTLMIGDSEVDAQCADRAGVPIILMEHGYGLPQKINGHATAADFRSLYFRICGEQLVEGIDACPEEPRGP